uniref:Transmembrane protein 14A n=1 Tax=Vombatus ursinus TaxID=29139 RepID=A0A4X2L863_VOMUR
MQLPLHIPQEQSAGIIVSEGFLVYHCKGSILSLVAGLFFGLLAGYGSYHISCDPRDVKMSLFTTFFLATIMGIRFKRSKKVMPAGIVAGLSLLRILRLVLMLIYKNPQIPRT